MWHHSFRGLASVAVVMAACGGPPGPAPTPMPAAPRPRPEVVIGAVLPRTGASAPFGASVHAGLALAVEEANRAVDGPRFRLALLDSGGGPAGAAEATRELLARHPALIVGEVSSAATLAVAGVLAGTDVPLLAPSATHARVTEAGARVFALAVRDRDQGRALGARALALGWRSVALVADPDPGYARGLVEGARAVLEPAGVRLLELPLAGGADPAPVAATLARARPDGVLAAGYYVEGGALLRALRAGGLSTPVIGGDGWDAANLAELAGAAAEGAEYLTYFAPGTPDDGGFAEAFQAATGQAPDGLAALGYEAGVVATAAIRRAGGGDVAQALAATALRGPTGPLRFGPDRWSARALVVVRLAHGVPVFAGIVPPSDADR